MGRRANGEGTVYQRKTDGRWVGAVTLDDGRRRSVYGTTQREARAKLKDLVLRVDAGLPMTSTRSGTLGAYLDQWVTTTLASRVASGRLKASTADSYADMVRLHITPELGAVPLDKLTPARIRTWLTAKQRETSARGTPLSSRTVAYGHAVLRKALADAQRDELVSRNVAALVEPPLVRRAAPTVITRAEARALLSEAADDRLGALWLLLLGVGLRRGEALALRWSNVDLDAGTLTVRKSLQRRRTGEFTPSGRKRGALVEVDPKTDASAATVALPAQLVARLLAHRKAQIVERMASMVWVDPDLVFTTSLGTALEPRNVNRSWDELCQRAGVRHLRIHDLRHATATFMLAAGVELKLIQATLRHSRLSTTADVYAHVLAEVQRSGADRMDGMLTQLAGLPAR